MLYQVVCCLGETMDSLVPRMVFISDDFPTLGLPKIDTNPLFIIGVYRLLRLTQTRVQ